MEGIRNFSQLQTGADLQQFTCAMQGMHTAIPQFSELIRPLMDFLEKDYAHVGKLTRLAAERVHLGAI